MIPWWKRLLYSLASVLVGGGAVGLMAGCQTVLTRSATHLDLETVSTSTLIVLAASLPGWIIAIPIVLSVKSYSGRHLWTWGAVGSFIGPVFIFVLALYGVATNPGSILIGASLSGASGFIALAGAVSFVTTAIYLFLVTRGQNKLAAK
jgi:hypothetical protein